MALVRVYCGLASANPPQQLAVGSSSLSATVVDDSGRLLDMCDIGDDPYGYAYLSTLLAERASGPYSVAIAADNDQRLVPALLTTAGWALAYVDGESTDEYADRFTDELSEEVESAPMQRRALGLARALHAGALSASLIPVPPELAGLKPVLAAHGALATGRHAAAVALREVLRELYPAALRAYPDPADPVALAVMDALPEPGALAALAGRGRDAAAAADAVTTRVAAAGVADQAAVKEAITALRVAIAETPRRNPLSKGLTATVAEAVRQAVSAVRACDAASTALVRALAERVGPATAAASHAAPSTPRTTIPRHQAADPRPTSAAPAPMPVPARAAAVSAPPLATRSPAPPPAGSPASESPAPPYQGLPRQPGLPRTPGAALAGSRHADPYPVPSGPPAPAPRPEAAAGMAPPHPISPPPQAPAPITPPPQAPPPVAPPPSAPPPVSGSPLDRAEPGGRTGTRPVSAPPPPPPGITPIGEPRPPAGWSQAGDPGADPAAEGGRRSRRDRLRIGRDSPNGDGVNGRLGDAFGTGRRDALGDDATGRGGRRGDSGRGTDPGDDPLRGNGFGDGGSSPGGNAYGGDGDDGRLQVPAPRPAAAGGGPAGQSGMREGPPPGSRADWPTRRAAEEWANRNAPPPGPADLPTGPDPRLDAPPGYGGSGHTPPPAGPVTPPWRADDLRPPEPPVLRLVEPTLPEELREELGYQPSSAPAEPPPLRLVEPPINGIPRSAPPVSADDDDNLLIFAQTRSAWFTGESNEGSFSSALDVGWRAAEQASRQPTVGERTGAGLPRRVPRANLVPGSPPTSSDRPLRVVRDPARIAAHTSGYFNGWRRGQEIGGYPLGARQQGAGAWDFSREDERLSG